MEIQYFSIYLAMFTSFLLLIILFLLCHHFCQLRKHNQLIIQLSSLRNALLHLSKEMFVVYDSEKIFET
uniref:Uncharacterized protein n=1 Tax=Arundo donax TaxID=35708 RepID=A0A0A9AV67_ARUDO